VDIRKAINVHGELLSKLSTTLTDTVLQGEGIGDDKRQSTRHAQHEGDRTLFSFTPGTLDTAPVKRAIPSLKS
jgi:hypothetical protein